MIILVAMYLDPQVNVEKHNGGSFSVEDEACVHQHGHSQSEARLATLTLYLGYDYDHVKTVQNNPSGI